CEILYDLDEALAAGPDAVMVLRVQRERMTGGGFFPTVGEYARRYGLTAHRAGRLPAHPLVLHPGPMHRGVALAGDVAVSARSVLVEQVASGVFVRIAVLYRLLATDAREATRRPPPAPTVPSPHRLRC